MAETKKALTKAQREKLATKAMDEIAGTIYKQLDAGSVPELQLSSRTKKNIRFDDRHRVWKYGDAMTTRSANKTDGAYMLLRTMYMSEFIKQMVKDNKSSTLREMYYISEG